MFSSLKLENGLKKHVRNIAEIKCGSVKLVVIFLHIDLNPNGLYYFPFMVSLVMEVLTLLIIHLVEYAFQIKQNIEIPMYLIQKQEEMNHKHQ